MPCELCGEERQDCRPRAAPQTIMKAEYVEKQREYEEKKARAKALQLRLTCTICGAKPRTLLNCPCGTTQYCSTECQRIDWRDRGHRRVCKKIQAAEAARAEAPTPPPSPPRDVFYGPAPRSHADEVRARIAAEHEAARVRREANPEPEPTSARYGSRCPICLEEWDVNTPGCFASVAAERSASRAVTRSAPARVPSVVYRAQKTMRNTSRVCAAMWRTRCRKRLRIWEMRTGAVTTAS